MKKLTLFIYFLTTTFLFAGKVIDLDSIKTDFLITGKSFDFFEDTSKQLSLSEIIAKSNTLFTDKHAEYETVNHVESDYWVKFYLKASDTTGKKIFEVLTPQTEKISFFVPKKDNTYSRSDAGYLLPFSNREYAHKNFLFDFQNGTDFSKPFFIKIHSSNKVGLLFRIHNQQYFAKYSLNEYLTLGLYYGVLCMLILYNFIIFLYLRKPVYLAYIFLVLSSIGLSLSDDGLGFAYIWQNHPTWSQPLGLDIFPICFLIGYTAYAITFLNNRYALIKKIITYTTTTYLVYFVADILFVNEKFYFSFIYSIPFIVIYISYCYILYKNEFKPARFYVLGNTFALLGIVIEQMRLLGIIEGSTFTVYAFELGIVLEFFSLSFSLAYSYSQESKARITIQKEQIDLLEDKETAQKERIEILKEKELLSKKVTTELEQKVAERTTEVTEANEKLQKLIAGLEEMSISLDKENWQLKRGIKQEKQKRLSGGTVTLEEINLLYPSKIQCLKFLEELKWVDGFSCKKCNHTNYSINEENRSRKCSKCGKIESVTSGSLFHAQKLDFQHLFMLAHLAFRTDKVDVSDIANQLQVSETSIYKFIKKARDKKEANPNITTWEELIF